MGGLVFGAEGLDENFLEGVPRPIAQRVVLCLVADGAIGEGCSAVTFHVGQDPMDLGLVVLELRGA